MPTPTKYLVTAIAAALAVPVALSGCASSETQEEVGVRLQHSIETSVAHVTGALVVLGSDGGDRTIVIRIYLDDVQSTVVSAAVDKSLRTAWRGTVIEPTVIYVSVVDGPKPAKASTADSDGIDMTAAATALRFPVPRIAHDTLVAYKTDLVEHYGPWQKS